MCGLALVASISLLASCGSSSESTVDAQAGSPAAATAPAPVPEVSGSTTSDQVAGTAAPGQPAATSAAPADVPELLNFTAPLVGGGEFSGATAAGRTTAFWFWAPT